MSIDSVYMVDSLTTGIYNFTLTDINGCHYFTSYNNTWVIDSVEIEAANINNLLSIDSIMGWQDTLCYGAISDSIIIYMNDAAMWPLTFVLDSNIFVPNDSLVSYSGIYTSLSANKYEVEIKDGFGCYTDTSFTIIEHSEIIIDLTADSVSCFGFDDGYINIDSIIGGTPAYSYSWNTNPVQTTQNLNDLLEGTYTVTVTDNNGCPATASIYVGEPDPLQSTVVPTVVDASCFGASDGSGSISVIGGSTPYNYVWDSNSSVTNSISSVSAGEYFCTITDDKGCEDTITYQ
jgi:hypothetical protein